MFFHFLLVPGLSLTWEVTYHRLFWCYLFINYFPPLYCQTAMWIKSAAVLKHALGSGFTSVVPNGFVFCTCDWSCVFAYTHTCIALRTLYVHIAFFLYSVHCVATIPVFTRLPEPICVPVGAILARRRPPLGTIWALLNAVSTLPSLSAPHCDESHLL